MGSYEFVWVASPQLDIDPVQPASLNDLARFPILTHARQTRPYDDVARYVANERDLTFRLVPSNNLAACMQMTVDGMGIATLPKAAVLDEIASGNLIEVEHSWVPQSLDIFARYDAEKSPLSVVKVAEIAGDVAANFRKQHSQPK